jgi:hypothetical protein
MSENRIAEIQKRYDTAAKDVKQSISHFDYLREMDSKRVTHFPMNVESVRNVIWERADLQNEVARLTTALDAANGRVSAAEDTINKLLKQSDVDGTDCCWACAWAGLDRGCGGRTPKWRGPDTTKGGPEGGNEG